MSTSGRTQRPRQDRRQAAIQLCRDKDAGKVPISVDAAQAPEAGNSPIDFTTPGGNTVQSVILKLTPITADNLNDVFEAGWYVTKEQICKGVDRRARLRRLRVIRSTQ